MKQQEHNVVMLPTTEASNLYHSNIGDEDKLYLSYKEVLKDKWRTPQHLYITSDEEINEEDWITDGKSVQQAAFKPAYHILNAKWKKIVATTDSKLWWNRAQVGEIGSISVAKIPQDFIEVYIKRYNQGNPITKIMLEVKERSLSNVSMRDTPGWSCNECGTIIWSKDDLCKCGTGLKLRKDNTVIIHPVQERMFTEADMHAAWNAGSESGQDIARVRESWQYNKIPKFKGWLEENYPEQ